MRVRGFDLLVLGLSLASTIGGPDWAGTRAAKELTRTVTVELRSFGS